MPFCTLHEKDEIIGLFEHDPYLNIYGLGDLDDLFWPRTCWYGYREKGKLAAAVCLYAGPDVPTLLALSDDAAAMTRLLEDVRYLLPYKFFAHLSPGLEKLFTESHDFESAKTHYKMALSGGNLLSDSGADEIVRLTSGDISLLQALYAMSYPGNWFDPDMLDQNRYFGIKKDGRLLCVAGTHVYSPAYRAAAIGNITTLPAHRGRGLAGIVTSRLCRMLLSEGLRVGLNVSTENKPAIACYERIGFRINAEYSEFTLQRKNTTS
ncbi:MAG: GNAT family N-acetyltransferase [Spirochaetales bacterium]|nr:GNAT family N-acetyltransferase [Spirochaetales bacterium]